MSDNPAVSYVERVRKLRTTIQEHAEESEHQRFLAIEVANAFAVNELYRLAAPTECGGQDLDPVTQMEVIEEASRADGSAGWNLMIGMETYGLVGPSMETCLDVIAEPSTIMASSTANVGTATRSGDNYRVSGQWSFVSGIHNAHVFGATVVREEDNNLDPPPRYYAILETGQYDIVDTWRVSGLRGSGSHDVRVDNAIVRPERIVATLGRGALPSRQLLMPLGVRLTFAKVGVALGIARHAIDFFIDFARSQQPRFTNHTLRDRRFAQRAVAQAEIRLRGCRAAVFTHANLIWEKSIRHNEITENEKAIAHLLASDAVQGCVECVEHVVTAAGTSANRLDNVLEKLSRDIRVVRQHATVAPHHIDDVSAVLLGLEPHGILKM